MLSKEKIAKFWEGRSEIKDPRLATHFKHDDTLDYDFDFILKHTNSSSCVLDLGCGTGAIVNKLESYVTKIVAVDKNENFLKCCIDSPKIIKKVADLPYYEDSNQYDLIVIFGVLNYLNDEEVTQLYKTCHDLLKEEGILLIKQTCGIRENIIVDGYSEALGQCYHALYRSLNNDRQLISNVFSNHILVDIYPEYLNPWPNTHFYAFIVEK
ncbi:MAG: class I SAM-dependent methyltransferase [Pseudomonadota bacterium]|mgnify:CR=1 FL=1